MAGSGNGKREKKQKRKIKMPCHAMPIEGSGEEGVTGYGLWDMGKARRG